MGAAAKSLGIELEFLYGERDRLMLRQTEEVTRRREGFCGAFEST